MALENMIILLILPFSEVEMLTSIVKKLGGFEVERTVEAACKHVICGYPPKRTLNVLRGIARGCWILSKEWVLKSLDCNKWLDEEEFELNYYLPAIKKVRVARQVGDSVFRHLLFTGCGPIYVIHHSCNPPAFELKKLLVLCGAYVVCKLRSAKVVVASHGKLIPISARRSQGIKFVNEKWVLDSISEDSVCPFSSSYVVHTAAD